MAEYIIRTDKETKKTHLLKTGNLTTSVGIIYTDFNLLPKTRDILTEEIVNPKINKAIGEVRLYQDENIISVSSRRKELSSFTQLGEYKEDGRIIHYKKLTKTALLSKEEYKALETMGITHAYFFGEESQLSRVFCFERDENISGVIYSRENNNDNALKGLCLVLAQRIEQQDFIFEFMRK